jgi:hypothetical protein
MEELVKILERKRDKIKEIFDLAYSTTIGDSVEAIEPYVEYIEKRGKLVDEAGLIEEELKEAMGGETTSDGLSTEAKDIAIEIDNMIKQIVTHEEVNQVQVQTMMDNLKNDIKVTKDGIAAKNYYQYTGSGNTSQYFDEKK